MHSVVNLHMIKMYVIRTRTYFEVLHKGTIFQKCLCEKNHLWSNDTLFVKENKMIMLLRLKRMTYVKHMTGFNTCTCINM